VCVVCDLERHEESFHFFALVLQQPIAFAFLFDIRGILEKCGGRSVVEERLDESAFVGVWLENRVGESALLPLDEHQVQRVLLQILVNFGLNLVLQRKTGLL
jgi:hypothetical protein